MIAQLAFGRHGRLLLTLDRLWFEDVLNHHRYALGHWKFLEHTVQVLVDQAAIGKIRMLPLKLE